MSKPLTAALFDSKIRNTRSPRLGSFEIGSANRAPCNAARKGGELDSGSTVAKVSTLAFFLTSLDKGQLRAGIDPVDGKTLLVSKEGSTPNSSFRAFVDCASSSIRIVTDANPEITGMITGIVAGMIFTTKVRDHFVSSGNMSHYDSYLRENLKCHKPSICFDAFYYDLKYSTCDAYIDIEYDKPVVDTAFARADSMVELEVPESLSPLLKGKFPFVGTTPAAAKSDEEDAKAPVSDDLHSFMEEVRGGKYRLFDIYFPNDSEKIPPLSDLLHYAPTENLRKLINASYKVLKKAFGLKPGESRKQHAKDMNDVLNVMLSGPPGTGKTSDCAAMCAALGIPMYHTVISQHTEEPQFNKMPAFDKDGAIRMVDQAMRIAYEHGGLILLDEALVGAPGVMTYLNNALESPYAIGDGEDQIVRSAFTIVAVAGNPGTAGTRIQSPAFFNRFGSVLRYEPPTRDEMRERIITKRFDLPLNDKKNAKVLERILDVYYMVMEGIKSKLPNFDACDQLVQALSFRSIRSAVQHVFVFGETLSDALMDSIINQVKEYLATYNDPEALKDFDTQLWPEVSNLLSKEEFGKTYGTEA